jgi:DnaJ family protein A protein 5
VPHLDQLPLSTLPETHLPGFARAFLSLSFQWLNDSSAAVVDWQPTLPDIVWPDDGELVA